MTDEEKKAKRRAYMRTYRARNRAKVNAYQRKYLSDQKNKKKHYDSCQKYRDKSMTDETKEKIRQYQREYYRKRKAEADKEALDKALR